MKYRDLDYVMAKELKNISLEQLGITNFCQLHFGAEVWDDREEEYINTQSFSWVHIPREMYNKSIQKVALALIRAKDFLVEGYYPMSLQGICPDGTEFQVNLLSGDVFSGWGDNEKELQWVMNLLE